MREREEGRKRERERKVCFIFSRLLNRILVEREFNPFSVFFKYNFKSFFAAKIG